MIHNIAHFCIFSVYLITIVLAEVKLIYVTNLPDVALCQSELPAASTVQEQNSVFKDSAVIVNSQQSKP